MNKTVAISDEVLARLVVLAGGALKIAAATGEMHSSTYADGYKAWRAGVRAVEEACGLDLAARKAMPHPPEPKEA